MTSQVLKKIALGSVLVFASDLLGKGASLGVRIVAGRHLGPSAYGLIILGVTLVKLATIFSVLGLGRGIAQQIPRSDAAPRLFQFALAVGVTISVVLLGILHLSAATVSDLVANESFLPVLAIFAACIPLLTVVRISIGGLRGYGVVHGRVLLENVAYRGVTFGMVLVGAYLGFSAVGIAASWLVGLATATVLSVLLLRWKTSLIDGFTGLAAFEVDGLRRLLSVSVPLALSSSAFVAMRQSDNFLIGYFASVPEVGIYDASFTLNVVLLIFTGSVGYLFMPYFSEEDATGGSLSRLYVVVSKWVILAALPVFLLLVTWPAELLRVAYGAEYAAGGRPLTLLAIGSMIGVATGINGHALTAIGRSKQILYGNLIGLVLNIALNVVLIPIAGITGAAVASAASFSVTNGYYGYVLLRARSIHPVDRNVLKPVVLMLLIVPLAIESGVVGQASGLLHLILLGGALYVLEFLVVLLSGSFDEEDRTVLRTALPLPDRSE